VQQGNAIELLFHPKNNFVADCFSSQNMQLELNAVVFKDIWTGLPSLPGTVPGNIIKIDENNSLWEALEKLNFQKSKMLLIKNAALGEVRFAGYDSLFTGLEALKEKSHE
jgi:hypothetical protein